MRFYGITGKKGMAGGGPNPGVARQLADQGHAGDLKLGEESFGFQE